MSCKKAKRLDFFRNGKQFLKRYSKVQQRYSKKYSNYVNDINKVQQYSNIYIYIGF